MTVCVVSGGAGFLGSHLCEHLLELGDRVICIDNLDTGSLENIEHIGQPEFEFINQDITEFVSIEGPVDFVYHLASPASPIDYARLPLHTLKVGSYGTHHMLGLAKSKRARFLLTSTSEVEASRIRARLAFATPSMWCVPIEPTLRVWSGSRA